MVYDYTSNSSTGGATEPVASFYQNLFSTYTTWLERSQETQAQVADTFLSAMEEALQRQRESTVAAQERSERFARLQRDWTQELARQFRDYQFQAAEQYRNTVLEAIDAWTDIASQQMRDTADRVRGLGDRLERLGQPVREVGELAHEDTDKAVSQAEATTERGFQGTQRAAEGAEEPVRRGATAARKVEASEASGNHKVEGKPALEVAKA